MIFEQGHQQVPFHPVSVEVCAIDESGREFRFTIGNGRAARFDLDLWPGDGWKYLGMGKWAVNGPPKADLVVSGTYIAEHQPAAPQIDAHRAAPTPIGALSTPERLIGDDHR